MKPIIKCVNKWVGGVLVTSLSLCMPLSANVLSDSMVIERVPVKRLQACPIDPLAQYVREDKGQDEKTAAMTIQAKQADSTPAMAYLLGEVELERGDEAVWAEALEWDRLNQQIRNTEKGLRYANPQLVLSAQEAQHDFNQQHLEASDATYYLNATNAQGSAEHIDMLRDKGTSDLTQVTYSSCVRGEELWIIRADHLHINQKTGRAVAKNASFRIAGVPVLYSPYLSFPIDDQRHSGLLVPDGGATDSGGIYARLPYYFNIAPNMDATLTSGFFSKRGFLLGGEWRYLNRWQQMRLSGEILPDDQVYKDTMDAEKYGNTRWLFRAEQQWHGIPNVSGDLLFQQVSDPDYLQDLKDNFGLLAESNLERHADWTYWQPNWYTSLRFQHHQVLDKAIFRERPYARMPQWLFEGNWISDYGIEYGLRTEAVYFTTTVEPGSTRPAHAWRFDLMPYIGYRAEATWGYLHPQIAYRYTHYNSEGDRLNYRYETHHTRSLPILSIDSGLFFERDTQISTLFGGGNFTQTLEPRLYYLYVPYRDQRGIPIFDTAQVSPSYNSLFLPNRFIGADRQGDANQLTLALTSRLLHQDSGQERLRVSLGQTHYFTKPRVLLNQEENTENISRSEWMLESEARLLDELTLLVNWQSNPRLGNSRLGKTTRATFDLRYQPSDRHIFNVAYRYSNDETERNEITDQIDFAGFYEINPAWSLVGRYNYSLETSKTVEGFLGAEYNDCCATVRVVGRYTRETPAAAEGEWRAYLQVEFNGFARTGRNIETLWQDAVIGYQPRY